ncbi:DUF4974 domain-containing protein [Pseudoflavitalea sp. G-6-1-2]|uniref:FecR family protein n=1 Tax=Pseudoflavitalea sp. G-6-1-2 TaxID=2728841 RepID=UPI00146F87C5|nr:FecR family protein [Pseudoflavitalea sp. G-6-1-2]NML23052.1 DUF4974 domain-containing protein [Pseudoflavitalea sp. G-6-1-2]
MQQSLQELLEKYLSESLTGEELVLFKQMLQDNNQQQTLEQLIDEYANEKTLLGADDEELKAQSFHRLKQQMQIADHNDLQSRRPVRRSLILKWSAAAAVLLMAGAACYIWLRPAPQKKAETALADKSNTTVPGAGIGPGGNKAVLTLADGRSIELDNAANGTLAMQGSARISKTGNGQLMYEADRKNEELLMNTISTPIGGQYQVVLPDGSTARLNAASSISFPASFSGKTRNVKITGEVFLSVAKEPNQPFMVEANGSTIKVLGTAFNINAYKDEAFTRTTLVEGAVSIGAGSNQLLLKPGQQAAIPADNSGIKLVEAADMQKILAWTNGLFNFEGAELPAVMRQLERWYNITVEYEGHPPTIHFKGKMYRNLNLPDVLESLKGMGLEFRMEGRRLIVK